MGKRFSENEKKVKGRENKEKALAAKAQKNLELKAKEEEKYWKEGEKDTSKRDTERKKREEQLAKKKERNQLLVEEESKLKSSIKASQPPSSSSSFSNLKPERQEIYSASNIDDALELLDTISASSTSIASSIEKHPERRLKAAYIAFEEKELPLLKKEYPTLRLSQLKELVKKKFSKSTENPMNQPFVFYDTKVEDVKDMAKSIQELRFTRAHNIIEALKSIPEWREAYFDHLPLTFAGQKPTKVLWALFRQGGTLCYILNLLMKNTISYIEPLNFNKDGPEFDSKSCKMNVFNFLQSCQEDFFIPTDQLFSVSELYSDDSTVLLRAIKLTEELLGRIDSAVWLAAHDLPQPLQKKSWPFSSSDRTSPILSASSSNMETVEGVPTDLRKKAVQELLDTERVYVSQLDHLQEYMQQIENDPDRKIPQDEIDIIFGNLNELVDFQRYFLIDLEATLTKPSDQQKLGQLFLSTVTHSKTFASYYQYVENYERAVDALQRNIEGLKKYDNVIPSGELQSYLIKPVQRICRYHILLKEIKKHSDPAALETMNIIKAYEFMKRIADQVNEEKRKSENAKITENLSSVIRRWGMGYSIDNFKPLLFYGTFPIYFDSYDEQKQLHVFLFEKAVLFGRSKGGLTMSAISKDLSIVECIEKSFIKSVSDDSVDGTLRLKVFWYSNTLQWFAIEFINEEVFKKWYRSLVKFTTSSLSEQNPKTTSENKNSRRRSKLLHLLGDTAQTEAPVITTTMPELESPPRLIKLIGPEFSKLVPLPENYSPDKIIGLFLNHFNFSDTATKKLFYRDTQGDFIYVENVTEIELAISDWVASKAHGAIPFKLQ